MTWHPAMWVCDGEDCYNEEEGDNKDLPEGWRFVYNKIDQVLCDDCVNIAVDEFNKALQERLRKKRKVASGNAPG